jgi:3-hydroxybutyryl-CoA dehydrogenase
MGAKNITVIGAGTMGSGIAHVFALYGYSVSLFDADPAVLEKARKTIQLNLERQVKKGLIDLAKSNYALENITLALY